MGFQLTDKVVIVTAGGKGIGAPISRACEAKACLL
jgi:NAD(P)-dependent dehydrogenase (short-subunit alcohol dehydrogenase family)